MLEEYDVQATRREAREEGKEEGREEASAATRVEDVINLIKELKLTLEKAINVLKLDPKYRDQVITELRKQEIVFTEQ